MNSGSLAQEVSEEKTANAWPRDCFCGILVKNVAAFFPCLKNPPEAKVKKTFRLIALAKEISKQPDINSVVWLLKFTLMKSVLMKEES